MKPFVNNIAGRSCPAWTRASALRALTLLAVSTTGSFAQDLPAAATILDRYVQVTGGRAAYEQHTTEVLTGVIEFPAQGLHGKLTRYAMAPDKEYSLVELEALGKMESGVHSGVPWEKSAVLGPRIKAGEEKEQSIREARFNGPIEWRTIYATVETAGVATINGDECYEIILSPAKGNPEHQFYSRKTGLLVRTTMTASSQMGELQVEANVSQYKTFGGILFPTHLEQKAAGQQIIITVESVGVNEAIPAETFEPPPDVAAMIRKQIAAAEEKL